MENTVLTYQELATQRNAVVFAQRSRTRGSGISILIVMSGLTGKWECSLITRLASNGIMVLLTSGMACDFKLTPFNSRGLILRCLFCKIATLFVSSPFTCFLHHYPFQPPVLTLNK